MRNYQFWIALAIYLIAFVLWPLDRRDAAGFVTALFPPTGLGHGLGYAIAAGVVSIGAAWMTWSFARGSHEVPVAATVICWIGFGLLLNWIGLAVVAAGMTVLAVLSRNRAPDDKTRSTLDWKRGILQSAYLWIAAAALVALALTLREPVFFGFLAAALTMRILAARQLHDRPAPPNRYVSPT